MLGRREASVADFSRALRIDPSSFVDELRAWADTVLGSKPDGETGPHCPPPSAPPQKPPPGQGTTAPPPSRPWGKSEELVARVIRYYDVVGAAGLDVLSTIRVGDVLHFWGTETDFIQKAKSIERKRLPVPEGVAGLRVGLKVAGPVREGDEVYRLRVPDVRRDREEALRIRRESSEDFAGIVRRHHAGAVTVALLLGRLANGQRIRIRGRVTDVGQAVESLRVHGAPVARVDGPAVVDFRVSEKVRAGDLVYRVKGRVKGPWASGSTPDP
jgi:hypothetical protein